MEVYIKIIESGAKLLGIHLISGYLSCKPKLLNKPDKIYSLRGPYGTRLNNKIKWDKKVWKFTIIIIKYENTQKVKNTKLWNQVKNIVLI
jgi:hypothetical protein